MKGLYKIICISNDKFYIGSSLNIEKRIKRHFKDLKKGSHHNIHLQRAFNCYGRGNFNWEVVIECDDIKKEEQLLLDNLDWTQCFNISKSSCGGDNYSNNPRKEETREKLIEILRKFRPINPDLSLEKNPNWREGSTFKYCSCGNRMSYYAGKCIKCSNKGIDNPFYGKEHSKNVKDKISKSRKQQGYLGGQQRKVIIEGVEFESVSEAARHIGVVPNTIINRIRNSKFINYKYKDQN